MGSNIVSLKYVLNVDILIRNPLLQERRSVRTRLVNRIFPMAKFPSNTSEKGGLARDRNQSNMSTNEDSEFLMRKLGKGADNRLRRTYIKGVDSQELIDTVVVATVGITFLPGADKPQVNRTEQEEMTGREATPKDSAWRVNTAGLLLSHFEVTPDLEAIKTDQTERVVERIRARLGKSDTHSDRAEETYPRGLPGRSCDAVTIDSEYVRIVNDLRAGEWDLEATLIEVDGISLTNLIISGRHLIAQGHPVMTFAKTKMLLETIMEDTLLFWTRSPTLSRMSTRTRIINSKNTRYGIDTDAKFQTLTTSKGIKEIISLSCSYFDSLDPAGSGDETQRLVRPKFLQMTVVLLSLLNDADLNDIKEFLESTYELKVDRPHLELLFLKVMPLASINSKIFLNGVIAAIEGYPLGEDSIAEGAHCWDRFIQRILVQGYLLPALSPIWAGKNSRGSLSGRKRGSSRRPYSIIYNTLGLV